MMVVENVKQIVSFPAQCAARELAMQKHLGSGRCVPNPCCFEPWREVIEEQPVVVRRGIQGLRRAQSRSGPSGRIRPKARLQ